jgi:MFS family permease
MNLTKKRWLLLGASCLINLCIGSLYAWSVFASPMAEYLSLITGNTVTGLAIVFAVANIVGPVTMISGGFINDRLGPRLVILIGGILFGGGMFLSGFANSLGMLIISYGLGVGLGVGMVYGCTVSNMIKFFPDHPGLAGGLSTAFYGISSILIPPVAHFLTTLFGITLAFRILGVVMLAVISGASFFIIPCPPGFVPAGWNCSPGGDQKRSAGKDWKGMLIDPVFYVMILLLCCGAFSGIMVISQAAALAQRMIGMSMTAAAIVVSVLALLNTCGRIGAGFLSDKLGVVKTLIIVFTLSIIGLLVLLFSKTGGVVGFYIGIACVGLTFGSIMGMFPGFTALQFGSVHNSVNYGIIFIGFAASGFFGPTIMSSILTHTGSYQQAFLAAIGFASCGIILTFIYRSLGIKSKNNMR